jgi:hypothetical protein
MMTDNLLRIGMTRIAALRQHTFVLTPTPNVIDVLGCFADEI